MCIRDRDVRVSLKKREGCRLLLGEIYEEMDREPSNEELAPKKKTEIESNKLYKPENDERLVESLDVWYKSNIKATKSQVVEKTHKNSSPSPYNNLSFNEAMSRARGSSDRKLGRQPSSLGAAGLQTLEASPRNGLNFSLRAPAKVQKDFSSLKSKEIVAVIETETLNSLQQNSDYKTKKLIQFYKSLPTIETLQQLMYDENQRALLLAQDGDETVKREDIFMDKEKQENMRDTVKFLLTLKMHENSTLRERAEFYEKESTLIESKLNKKIRDVETFANNKTNTIRMLRAENSAIFEKVRQIHSMIRILNEKLDESALKEGSRSKADRRAQIRVENVTELFLSKYEREQKLKEDLKVLNESYTAFKQKIDYNNGIIRDIEREVAGTKKDLKVAYKSKIVFLTGLLKQGLDCRSQGLSWIIKSLWNLGEKVYEAQLPDFLDSKAKSFLMNKSRKELLKNGMLHNYSKSGKALRLNDEK
eukprot:TRINITY_DN7682_c0_g1_i2.p1 TRINITY_DN7682_c0_g1~~TRINITY_DN7682_c0_g1_i2.p1  ORF type:complete len:477 (+),score=114.79 TRINITY_DN7682_c0_g1_i2:64-1494(+)